MGHALFQKLCVCVDLTAVPWSDSCRWGVEHREVKRLDEGSQLVSGQATARAGLQAPVGRRVLSSPGRERSRDGRCASQREGLLCWLWASTTEEHVLKSTTEKYTVVERIEGSPEILRCLCDLFTFLYEKDLDFDHQFVYSLYSVSFLPWVSLNLMVIPL